MHEVSSFHVFFAFSKFIGVPVHCQKLLFTSAAFLHKEHP